MLNKRSVALRKSVPAACHSSTGRLTGHWFPIDSNYNKSTPMIDLQWQCVIVACMAIVIGLFVDKQMRRILNLLMWLVKTKESLFTACHMTASVLTQKEAGPWKRGKIPRLVAFIYCGESVFRFLYYPVTWGFYFSAWYQSSKAREDSHSTSVCVCVCACVKHGSVLLWFMVA